MFVLVLHVYIFFRDDQIVLIIQELLVSKNYDAISVFLNAGSSICKPQVKRIKQFK